MERILVQKPASVNSPANRGQLHASGLRKRRTMSSEHRSEREDLEANLKLAKARLDRLERQEWWRWGLAFLVMLALTAGMFALSLPGSSSGIDPFQLNIGLKGLLGLVLLFDAFVIHQQFLIKKLRRELAAQLGLISAFELIHEPAQPATALQAERRRVRRSGLDRRLRVVSHEESKSIPVHGRIRDIGEDGLGAVIPCSLKIGEEVTLEFSVEEGDEAEVGAIVRHRRSFHYGFEFIRIDANVRRAIKGFVESGVTAAV
jgi:PilZ domain